MDAVTVKGLDKNMGRFRLKDINLSIRKGYITGLIGENGSGKSTLIHHMLTLKKQDGGRISILDKDLELEREELLNRIGLVFAEDRFPQNISPKDSVMGRDHLLYNNWHADHDYFAYLEGSACGRLQQSQITYSTERRWKLVTRDCLEP